MSENVPSNPLPSEEIRRRLFFTDQQLLAECEVHLHRTGGPGGQHRNKVSSAVRLHHKKSGIVVTATERRSQHENRANAVERLREAIAIYSRAPLPEPFAWPEGIAVRDEKLRVSQRNPLYPQVVALALDALEVCAGVHQDAARRLGVTPTSLVRFLADDAKAWPEANRIRSVYGLPPLRA